MTIADYQDRVAARTRLREFAQQVIAAGGDESRPHLADDLHIIIGHSDRCERQDEMAAFRRGVIPASTGDAGIIFIPEQVFDKIVFDLRPDVSVPTIIQVEADVDLHSFIRGYNAAKVINS